MRKQVAALSERFGERSLPLTSNLAVAAFLHSVPVLVLSLLRIQLLSATHPIKCIVGIAA
jgi:hypothetical protein